MPKKNKQDRRKKRVARRKARNSKLRRGEKSITTSIFGKKDTTHYDKRGNVVRLNSKGRRIKNKKR